MPRPSGIALPVAAWATRCPPSMLDAEIAKAAGVCRAARASAGGAECPGHRERADQTPLGRSGATGESARCPQAEIFIMPGVTGQPMREPSGRQVCGATACAALIHALQISACLLDWACKGGSRGAQMPARSLSFLLQPTVDRLDHHCPGQSSPTMV